MKQDLAKFYVDKVKQFNEYVRKYAAPRMPSPTELISREELLLQPKQESGMDEFTMERAKIKRKEEQEKEHQEFVQKYGVKP